MLRRSSYSSCSVFCALLYLQQCRGFVGHVKGGVLTRILLAGMVLPGAMLAGVILAADKVGEAEVEGVVMVVAVQLVMGPTKQVMYLCLVACVAGEPLMGP